MDAAAISPRPLPYEVRRSSLTELGARLIG